MLWTTKWFCLELNSELSGVYSSCRVVWGSWKHPTSSEEGPGLGMQAGDRAPVEREDGKKASVRRITLTKAGCVHGGEKNTRRMGGKCQGRSSQETE